jgi:hypothetical protein
LFEFHDRHLALRPEGGYHRIREAVLGPGMDEKLADT